MEAVDCLLCGCPERRVRFHGSDRLVGVPGEFTLVECGSCGFVYLSPRPDPTEIDRFYPDSYAWTAASEESSEFMRKARAGDLARLRDVVLNYHTSGALLDVGCGVGDFLATMRDSGDWQVHGLEPSPALARQAIEGYGLTLDPCRLEDAPYPPGSFDVVTLWEVLEHLPQPRDALRQIHTLLSPGGVVVMSLPDRDSLEAKVFGPAWVGLDVPRHFSVFSQPDITRALAEAGFDRPDIFTLAGPLGTTHNGLRSLLLSLHIWSQGDGAPGPLRRSANAVLRPLLRQPAGMAGLFLVSWPYQQLARLRNRGSSMTVVARRP